MPVSHLEYVPLSGLFMQLFCCQYHLVLVDKWSLAQQECSDSYLHACIGCVAKQMENYDFIWNWIGTYDFIASYPGSSPEKQGESLEDLIMCTVTYYVWFYE